MTTLTAQLIRYAPGLRMAPHADGCRRLSVLVDGDQFENGPEPTHASIGSVAIKAPEFVHRNRFGAGGCTIISAIVPDALLEALDLRCDRLPPCRWHHDATTSLLGLRLAAGLRRGDGAAAIDVLRALLRRFSRSLEPASAPGPAPDRLERVRRLLHEDPSRPPDVAALAAREHLHPVSLNRAFRRRYGCSLTRYRQRLRVLSAARAIVAGTSLVNAALDHCFSDLSHLTRVFQREVGVPPGRFRSALRPPAVPGPDGHSRLDSFKTEWSLEL